MSDQPNDPPEASETMPPGPISACPACGRKLLTQTSALCNWCGAKIDNSDYQQRAAENRMQHDRQEREELEALIQEEAQHGILGRLKRLGKQNKVAPKRDPLL